MIIGIAIFNCKEGKGKIAQKGLEKNLAWAREQAGHIKSFLAQPQDGTNRYLVYSEWEREEDFIAVKRKLMGRGLSEMEELFDWMEGDPFYGSFQILKDL